MDLSITNYFPKYHQLNLFEKFILRTCCYYPPKKKIDTVQKMEFDLNHYAEIFKNAFGSNVFELFNNKKILDFGCGEGPFTLTIGKLVTNADVSGIDIQNNFEAAINQMHRDNIVNVNFILGSTEILTTNSFDFVFSHDSFEHFENPEYIFGEMLRIIKPGGAVMIKFGPTWKGPYGRHMSGTFRKDRPWLHLIIPEIMMMRIHSVYSDYPILFEKYSDLKGGLNKMTVNKAFKIFNSFENCRIIEVKRNFLWKGVIFKNTPLINELLTSSLYVKLEKTL